MPTHLLLPVRATPPYLEADCTLCRGAGCYRCRYGGRHFGAAIGPLSVFRHDLDELPVERYLARPPAPAPVPVPDDLSTDPVPRARARLVLQLMLEVLDGHRPLAQLHGLAEPVVQRYVRAAADRSGLRPRHGSSRLLRLRLCQPHASAVEIAAVCRIGGRPRAVAARLDVVDIGAVEWRCTVLRIG